MVSKFFGGLGRFFITSGVVILLFVGYQLWGTGIQEASAQNDLGSDFDELLQTVDLSAPVTTVETTTTTAAPTTTQAPTTSEVAEATTTTTTTTTTTIPEAGGALEVIDDAELAEKLFRQGGEAVAQIQIPQIDVDKYVVSGVQVEDLRNGPGHYRSTVFPGQEGNAGIAGHRTTYGAPFNRIDELQPGDEFEIVTVQGVHTYRIMSAAEAFNDEIRGDLGPDFVLPENADEVGHIIVPPQATWVLGDFGDNRVTLTACHPKFSAALRIIVAAELVSAPVNSVAPPADFDLGTDELISEDLSAEQIAAEVGEGLDEEQVDAQASAFEADRAERNDAASDLPEGTDVDVAGFDPAIFANEVSLDEGLNGESEALQPAILFGLIAIALYFAFKELARRWKPWPALFLGIAPVLFFMALSFEKIDRFLPAG